MTWNPERTQTTGPVEYNNAPLWRGGENCSGTYTPGARALAAYIRQRWPFVSEVGGYSCRPNTAVEGQTSIHGVGRAIDIMVTMVDGAADRRGDEIAQWLIDNASALGVQVIIWDGTIWSVSRNATGASRPYTGPIPHTDHLHVELNEQGAALSLPWYEESIEASSGAVTALVIIAAVGAASYVAWKKYRPLQRFMPT